jgi:hypothetical protein
LAILRRAPSPGVSGPSVGLDHDPPVIAGLAQHVDHTGDVEDAVAERYEGPLRVDVLQVDVRDPVPVVADELDGVAAACLQVPRVGAEPDPRAAENPLDVLGRLDDRRQVRWKVATRP